MDMIVCMIIILLISLTLKYQAPVYYAQPPPSVGKITVTEPKTLNCYQGKSANICGFLNLNDYTISCVTISGRFSCTKGKIVNNIYSLQTIIIVDS